MNTLTAKEQTSDSDSQFSLLATDDRSKIIALKVKGKNLLKVASPKHRLVRMPQ